MLEEIKDTFNNLPAEAISFMVALGIGVLRVIYDQSETRPMRIVLEGLMCGCLGMTAGWGVQAMGLDYHWSYFCAAFIGYVGSMQIRALVLKFLNKKIEE